MRPDAPRKRLSGIDYTQRRTPREAGLDTPSKDIRRRARLPGEGATCTRLPRTGQCLAPCLEHGLSTSQRLYPASGGRRLQGGGSPQPCGSLFLTAWKKGSLAFSAHSSLFRACASAPSIRFAPRFPVSSLQASQCPIYPRLVSSSVLTLQWL